MRVYDTTKGNLIIDGMAVTGFSKDKKIQFEYNEDFIEPHVDVDGEASVAEKNDRSAKVTASLNSSSPWIRRFYKYAIQKKAFPIAWEDFNDDALSFSGEYARVIKAPDIHSANSIEDQDVVIWIGKAIVK